MAKGFRGAVTEQEKNALETLARQCRGDILKMTTVSGSGHPGGSMSSIDMYLVLYTFANISPDTCDDPSRDRIVVSHGHTSPGLYSSLAALGFIDRQDLLAGFRSIRSPFEGHIERQVPGVEWSTGNLGQGLSAGCGFALASKLKGWENQVFVVMGDAEQAKGQVAEARRFCRKYGLNNITVLVDYNHFQISGRVEDIMPVNIKENYVADGWQVLEAPGHDHTAIHNAITEAVEDPSKPYAVLFSTTIGKGVSFMENKAKYHGQALSIDECRKALAELNVTDDLNELFEKRKTLKARSYKRTQIPLPSINTGKPRTSPETADPRAVFGSSLEDIAKQNAKNLIAVFDCDLADSVKTTQFAKVHPENYFESGVSEHTTATIAGALSINGIVSVWADFGVFAIDEVYNQLRLNDINNTNLKIIATHLGHNVGPDGKTHQCIDYLGVLRNLFGFKVVVPADPNQTDHAVRYVLKQKGNWVIGMGRTKLPVIKTAAGKVLYDEKYVFEYGKIDLLRDGNDCAIFTMGAVAQYALQAHEMLVKSGIHARVYCVSAPLSMDREIVQAAARTKLIISHEDHNVHSGMGSQIAQSMVEAGIATKLVRMGVTQYGGSDEANVLYEANKLDAASLVATVKKFVK
jgi:transketolase